MTGQSVTALLRTSIMNILKKYDTSLSISEIKENLAAMGITDYRQGHLAGSLKQILDNPDYISPSRGRYQYVGTAKQDEKQTQESSSTAYQMAFLYEDTVRKASGILNHIDIVNTSEKEMEQILRLREFIVKTKEMISKMRDCDI